MILEKKECLHFEEVLNKSKEALKSKNPVLLKELSNQTIHSACNYQDAASITIAVILYSLSKLIEREDYNKVKNWDLFVKKFNATLDLAVLALKEENQEAYEKYILNSRNLLESNSINLKKYIQDILKKASINKGSKIYEHGISLEQTSKLLGISQWELSDYIGQKSLDVERAETITEKKRAKLALEFFGED